MLKGATGGEQGRGKWKEAVATRQTGASVVQPKAAKPKQSKIAKRDRDRETKQREGEREWRERRQRVRKRER